MGGPPTVPQALNRYAATSVGQPGVRAALQNGNGVIDWIQGNWYKQAVGTAVNQTIEQLAGIKIPVKALQISYTFNYGKSPVTLKSSWIPVGKNLWRSIDDGAKASTNHFLLAGLFSTDSEARWITRRVDNVLKRASTYRVGRIPAGRLSVNLGVAIALDIGFEGYEYATGTGRWGNPYWTPQQKFRQAGVAIAGDLGIVLAIAAWNPKLWVAIPVYFVVSMAWTYIHPVLLPGQFEENRNLAPLVQQEE